MPPSESVTLKGQYVIEPSLESYTRLLEITCAESAFWRLQGMDGPAFCFAPAGSGHFPVYG